MEIESEVIQAKTRKLKAVWTFEAAQDMRSQVSVEAEDELAKILAEEICHEIDQEILNDLKNNAAKYQTEEYQFKMRKRKIIPRSITDDWEVSRFD